MPLTRRLRSIASKGASCPLFARGCCTSTVSKVRPTMCGSRPRRTTSTSGNSGIKTYSAFLLQLLLHADNKSGLFSSLLFGLLFIRTNAFTQQLPINMNLGSKDLVVFWTSRSCGILWSGQFPLRAQLLQAGLPVHVVAGRYGCVDLFRK